MTRRSAVLVALGLALAGPVLASCGGSDAEGSHDMTQPSPAEAGTILDVRDVAEWRAGHLAGATLLSFNTGEFEAELDSLDPSATYTLYCRSGNRSGQAAAMMRAAGFRNIHDLGSLENAAEVLGLDIVTD